MAGDPIDSFVLGLGGDAPLIAATVQRQFNAIANWRWRPEPGT
jgi:hypothetical protein